MRPWENMATGQGRKRSYIVGIKCHDILYCDIRHGAGFLHFRFHIHYMWMPCKKVVLQSFENFVVSNKKVVFPYVKLTNILSFLTSFPWCLNGNVLVILCMHFIIWVIYMYIPVYVLSQAWLDKTVETSKRYHSCGSVGTSENKIYVMASWQGNTFRINPSIGHGRIALTKD